MNLSHGKRNQSPTRPLGFLFPGDIGGEQYATSGNQGTLKIQDGLE
jgi:hypothetical protein